MSLSPIERLPNEMLGEICTWLCGHCHAPARRVYAWDPEEESQKALYNLCFVNHTFRAAAQPVLYHWPAPIRNERALLLTMYRRPGLLAYAQRLGIVTETMLENLARPGRGLRIPRNAHNAELAAPFSEAQHRLLCAVVQRLLPVSGAEAISLVTDYSAFGATETLVREMLVALTARTLQQLPNASYFLGERGPPRNFLTERMLHHSQLQGGSGQFLKLREVQFISHSTMSLDWISM